MGKTRKVHRRKRSSRKCRGGVKSFKRPLYRTTGAKSALSLRNKILRSTNPPTRKQIGNLTAADAINKHTARLQSGKNKSTERLKTNKMVTEIKLDKLDREEKLRKARKSMKNSSFKSFNFPYSSKLK